MVRYQLVGLAIAAALGLGGAARAATVAMSATGLDPVGFAGALQQAYGATTSSSNTANFFGSTAALGQSLTLTSSDGSTITFTRMDDSEAFVTSSVTATFEAKWSANTPQFFGVSNVDGSNPATLITGTGPVGSGTGDGPVTLPIPSLGINSPVLGWFRDGSVDTSTNFYSNGDPHVVTFAISGTKDFAGNTGSFLMAFNDPGSSDSDYNDLMVQISGVTPVPLPAAVLSGAAMLGGLGLYRRLRPRPGF